MSGRGTRTRTRAGHGRPRPDATEGGPHQGEARRGQDRDGPADSARRDTGGAHDCGPQDHPTHPQALGPALVHLRDPAGRPRGLGFAADHLGTLITSHEAVDGLTRLVVHTADDRSCVVTADAVTALPHRGLALVRTEGLGLDPLPVTARDRIDSGTYVRVPAGCWREARVLGATGATYTAADRAHPVGDALELAIGTAGRDALRPGGGAAGGPVLDAATGAAVGVVVTALRAGATAAGLAVPLRPAADGPLADVLARNAATVPAYGADLNPAGMLELTAVCVGQDGPPGALPGHGPSPRGAADPVERAVPAAAFAAFTAGDAAVLALVGAPGSGRTTELAALAARRSRDPLPAPTLWLRGADLHEDDTGVADAARRALARAARIVAVSRGGDPADLGDLGPEHLARLARTVGRPLLLLLDGPEEMPPVLAHRLPAWTEGTADWLRRTGARLVIACRPEYWEGAGAHFPRELLHTAEPPGDGTLPPCVPLGDLVPEEARLARQRHRVPEDALPGPDARHPLTLRLLAEVRAALPEVSRVRADRHDVLSAHLDLMCLRVAVRLAAENELRGTAVRRLAAKVAGQVHEAARRSLGPGQGELDRQAFETVFPWGPAPTRLGGGTGWASAVLAEGLLVPAGGGYRFAHEELSDWLQGTHLDLDEALRALVHRDPREAHPLPVPHHRIGPVVQAMLVQARQHGTRRLALRLDELTDALEADPDSWWAARLVTEVLARVPDATPYLGVLGDLADRIAARRLPPARFGPAFWSGLPLRDADRLDLLRRLVLADTTPQDGGAPRFLDTTARLLAGDPATVQPHLTHWFDDERPLPATPHATVATAAQALLHTHRHGALDDLTEVLVDSAHHRADELLAVLAEDEPSALCRAVERWARDERPDRRVAAVAYGLRAAPYVRSDADRELLRHAALALLAGSADATLHGGALALLVRDPRTRARHLPEALRRFAAGDPHLPPGALLTALATHPEPVLDAFRTRLAAPNAGDALRALAEVGEAGPARRVAALVREAVAARPDVAEDVAGYVDRCLNRGPSARAVLLPLVTGLLHGGPERVRAALAAVLATPGAPASRPLRAELRGFLLAHEQEPAVLAALLHAAVYQGGDELRDLLHRTGLLLVRTPEGASRLDRGLVDLARHVPGFAALMAGWLSGTPGDWAAVVGPSTRRVIENLASGRVLV
ncbi:trypsin-like peptidase domain-containing protein [Streptomyces actuosus]|uniref:trypsin-like peptidase domain-containing protein n=1 Tax=Streptomyces actuosus TaxID=1885 RepID=UPI001F06BB23|nr:trypsin-like peptidase domain-containing protein [Streptomyces actuosus]